MDDYGGLDVSLELSRVCILNGFGQNAEANVASEPEALTAFSRQPEPAAYPRRLGGRATLAVAQYQPNAGRVRGRAAGWEIRGHSASRADRRHHLPLEPEGVAAERETNVKNGASRRPPRRDGASATPITTVDLDLARTSSRCAVDGADHTAACRKLLAKRCCRYLHSSQSDSSAAIHDVDAFHRQKRLYYSLEILHRQQGRTRTHLH